MIVLTGEMCYREAVVLLLCLLPQRGGGGTKMSKQRGKKETEQTPSGEHKGKRK